MNEKGLSAFPEDLPNVFLGSCVAVASRRKCFSGVRSCQGRKVVVQGK